MNDEEILLGLGFTLNEMGAILNKDGNYVPSVEHNGRIIESNITKENHDAYANEQETLTDIGFEYDANSDGNKYHQERIALAKDEIKKYETNPEENSLPENADQDPIYGKAFFDLNNEKDNTDVYPTMETMVEMSEEGTILEDIESPEDKQMFKTINKRLAQIEDLDPDRKTKFKQKIEQDVIAIGAGGIPVINPGEDGSFLDKLNFKVTKELNDVLNGILSGVNPTGAGMESDLLKSEYKKLKQGKKEILQPVAAKKLEEVNILLEDLKAQRKETDYWSTENDKYAWSITKLEKQQNRLEDYINNDSIDSNIFSVNNITDWASLGIYDAYAAWRYMGGIRDKIEAGEELSPADIAIAQSSMLNDKVEGSQFEQKYWHNITGGTNESLKFLGFGFGGRAASRVVGKAVGKTLIKPLGKGMTNRLLNAGSRIGTQGVLHPYTYKYAFEKYAGNFDVDENGNILAGERLYNSQKIENAHLINEYEDALAMAKATGDKEQSSKLAKELKSLHTFDENLQKPMGKGNALIYGLTEVMKENIAENYGSRLYRGIGLGRVEKAFNTTKLGKALTKNKLTKGLNQMKSGGKKFVNKHLGTIPGEKIISSNTEEIFEELLVQATPSYGSTWEEYKEQASELGKGSFYSQVIGQTLLMQKTMQVGGVGTKQWSLLNMTKAQRTKRKATLSLYKELGKNRALTQEQFNGIMMKAGHGDFSTQEFDNQIKTLRKEGKIEEANTIEQNKVYKQAVSAQKQGLLPEFKKAMTKAKFNKNLSPETIANIELVTTEISEMVNDDATYINKDEVVGLKSKKRYAQKTIDELDAEKTNIDVPQAVEDFEKVLEKQGLDTSIPIAEYDSNPTLKKYVDDNFSKLPASVQKVLLINKARQTAVDNSKLIDKEISNKTSYEHQLNLGIEQDYLSYIDFVNRKAFSGNMTADQFNDVIEKTPKSKQKHITKDRLTELHSVVSNSLVANELNTKILNEIKKKQNIKIKEDEENVEPVTPVEGNVEEEAVEQPPSVLDSATQEVLNTAAVVLAEPEPNTDKFDTENGVVINNSDEFDDLMIGDALAEQFQNWAKTYEEQEGKKPTFLDFFNQSLKNMNGDKSAFDKDSLRRLGTAWQDSGLGNSNWEDVYKTHYTSSSALNQAIVTSVLTTNEEGDKTQQIEESQVEEIKKVQPPTGTNPITGEPIKITPVQGKTVVVTGKANYSAIKYDNSTEVVEIDGKKVVVYTKEDVTNNEEVPVFNNESFIDMKALLHPDRNNPGDTWTPNITTEADWGNPTLLVAKYDPKTFTTTYVSFSQWIKENQPKGMSLAKFKKTDVFIAKVPMYYTDAQGSKVAFVGDTDWYSPLSVRDTTKEAGEYVELDNLTETHKNLIKTGKDNVLSLRKAIADGTVKEVTIASKQGSPMLSLVKKDTEGKVLPTRPLSESTPDAKIVFLKGDTFRTLDGVAINRNEVEILNESTYTRKRKDAQGNKIVPYEPMMLSPVNKVNGVQKYMAIPLNRLDENGNRQAHSEDIATAKWILGAHETLYKNKPSRGVTIEQAVVIRDQIKTLTGVDITNLGNASQLAASLIALQDGNKKAIPGATDVSLTHTKRNGYFIDALFEENSKYTVVQNTNISATKAHGLKITRPDGLNMVVEKPTDSYEEFLRTRLSTSVLSYNMGTEESPAYTYSVQPIIELSPIGIELEQAQEEVQEESTIPVSKQSDVNDALTFLRENGGEIVEDNDDLVGTLESTETIEEALNVIPGLTLDQQNDVVNHLLALLSDTYTASGNMTLREFKEMTDVEFNKFFHKLLTDYKNNYNTVNDFYQADVEKNRELEPSLRSFQKNIGKLNTIIDNFDSFFKKAYLEGMRKGFIASTIKTSDDLSNELRETFEDEMYQKDFHKTSNEIVHKDKVSSKLKRLFSTISNGQKGFLGIPKYENYDTMYNTIATRIASPLPSDPSFKAMMERLEEIENSHPWIKPLIKKLEESDTDVQNSLVVNMYKYAANAKFIMIKNLPNGVASELWFSNANNIKQKIKESWNNNFKRSNATNGNTLNTEKLGKLYDQWESWGENKHEQSDEVLRTWLNDFGIKLSDGAWKELKDGKYLEGEGKTKTALTFEKLFYDTGKRRSRLFSNLANYAKQHSGAKQNTLDFVNSPKEYHPHNDMGSIIPQLVEMEARHNTDLINITRRDGDKTVSELVFPSFFFNNVRKLIHSSQSQDKEYLNYLQGLDFSSDNYILQLLMNNDKFPGIFNYGETGLMSMKKRFTNNPKYSKVEQLSPIDYMFHQRAMFQYMQTKGIDAEAHGFKLRVGTMSTPTNSDKGRMMLLQTAVFDLFSDDAGAFNDNGTFTEKTQELLYKTLVEPELKRIVNHTDVNIKDYNKGAGRFNLIPVLNTVLGKDGVKAIEHLKTNSDLDKFKENFFESISTYLEESITLEAKDNVEKTKEFTEGKIDNFNNRDYIARGKKTKEQKALVSELDYTINSMISNMTSLQLIAGDPAMYYKSKGDNESSQLNEQVKVSKDLGVNLGKRLALMIAPGNVLANSDSETYLQLFLQDSEEVAQDVEEIIGWHYGKKALKETFNNKTYKDIIDNLRAGEYKNDNNNAELKALQDRFSKVKAFLQIESTDAQEYTTVREHLRVLEGLGRVSEKESEDIISKIYGDEDISDTDMKALLDIVLQPLKPVYTGDIDSEGVRRIMYIKSSSFPLIPQLVKGSKLEPLMRKMEELEKTHQTKVRASYQSANKVGAMDNPIDPFDAESLSLLDEVNDDGAPTHALKLDRINFKIQQDIPFKEENQVSMGTQIFKLLFGDGIDAIQGFQYDGRELSGAELKQEFFSVFSEIVGLQKDKLLDNLGLNDDYSSNNPLEAAKKLQQLLKKEAEERGFSENDIKSLDLHKTVRANGEEVYHFKSPLWFSGNSNKFESMLNAIIGNKIFKQKLPGNSFVVGSEAGMQFKEGIENVEGNNIVFIGDYRGGELKGTEVLAPSKFKLGGKYIDLFKKNKKGKYIYLKKEGNGFIVNPEVISPELLENFTFRTPTSSHGSASTIKIVGFIPSVMGDLMITPKNFVAQMGQDFDIDKLTSYQYHYYDNQGKIERFNIDHKEYILDQIRKENTGLDAINRLIQSTTALQDEDGNFANDPDLFEINEELTEAEILDRVRKKLDLKLSQNKFIEIHNAVYSNPSADVQKKINKVLSMDFAENQAEAIDELVDTDVTDLNILSPTYQMNKMIAGSTGSLAIGIYAKGVTFNSLAQQTGSDKIALQLKIVVDDEVEYQNKTIKIGKLTSDGTFGNLTSISIDNASTKETNLARSLAEVQDERVNTATDNEKAQILGRVGITHISSVAVDNLLSLLGFDAERTIISKADYDSANPFHKLSEDGTPYTEYSIPYLLHSQPIIKEYFNRLKNGRAIIQDFQEDIEEAILADLLNGYESENKEFSAQFTGERLAEAVKKNVTDDTFQKEILMLYSSLIKDANELKKLQETVDMSNLGKSMWELKDKVEKFKNLPLNTSFSNIEALLGRFDANSGELDMGGTFFTPTTNQGVMVGTALSMGRNLFFNYFPYYDTHINKTIESIFYSSSEDKSDVPSVDFQQTIFQEMKKYLTSATRNHIFLDTPDNERDDLFIDKKGHDSLSTYVANLFNNHSSEFTKGLRTIKKNFFLSYLNYTKGDANRPSLIRFDNTETANVSEEHFHNAFKELFVNDIPLPNKNGKPYSTRLLAQELVAYSHLSGGIVREAIEFHRFIPIEYYDSLKTANGKSVTQQLQAYDTMVTNWEDKQILRHFKQQFFQNSPQHARQLSEKDRKDNKKTTFKDGTLEYNVPMKNYPQYLSFKNKTKSKIKRDKWSLYKNIGHNKYEKIDVLGDFGMAEYDYNSNNLSSVMPKTVAPTNDPSVVAFDKLQGNVKNTPSKESKGFSISSSDSVMQVLEKIENNTFKYNPNLSKIAKALTEMFEDKGLNIPISVINDPTQKFRGRFKDGVIIINAAHPNMAQTFIHEFIHSVTSSHIKQYYDVDGNILSTAPKEVVALNILFEEYKKQIIKAYPEDYKVYLEKMARYNNNQPVTFTDRETSLFYSTKNIREFLAVSLSNNKEFLDETSKMPYKKSGKILDKFAKVIDSILETISGKKSTIAEQTLSQSLEVVKAFNPAPIQQEMSTEEMKSLENDYVINQPNLFDMPHNSAFGNVVQPTEADFKNIDTTNDDLDRLPDCIT